MSNLHIVPFQAQHWPQLWPILRDTFQRGDTYAFPTDWDEAQTRHAWIDVPVHTFVAVDDAGMVLGSYYLKPNQLGGGSHVANCGYVVSAAASGRGIASQMCRHSQDEARRLGFLAMQFNFVVSSNSRAVALWQHLGFTIVGTLPLAFRHPQHGLVDAYVMHKPLHH
ncbi:GNAT family N-acetyltransferase [Lysobacteraceae bacterium NML08-0793]|nr:GNAT family N-acetyltransferase [Xanthomonadaceae bacterium NML08-0793]